jgi:ribonuclease VapC
MTLDASVVIAILLSESGALDLVDRILEADVVRIGTPTLVETAVVLANKRQRPSLDELRALIDELGITVVAFDAQHWEAAASAFERFGRGRHKAGLNFGDCMTYATAAVAGDSLLFIGNDFTKTDIRRA